MRVLAIGATGFIGQNVVHLLVNQGHDVAVLHRGKTGASVPEGARHIRGNRNRLEDSQPDLDRFAPDVVLDVILYTEQQAREMVKTFRGKAGRVVAVSSADVYRNYDGFRGKASAPPDPVPLAEEAPLRETRYPYRGHPLPFEYSHHYEKILVEQVLLSERDLSPTVLRLPAVYGPGDRQHRLETSLPQWRLP
jgi:nucleoside-diphosphate-sugar epimerase